MTIKVAVDTDKRPIELRVESDRRKVTGTVTVGGETANYVGAFEPVITDSSNRVWTKRDDDGTVAVYTSPA